MLGARIAALRKNAGMSQSELAKKLQVSASAVGMYEQGRREPGADTLVALAEVFGVSTDYLLTGRAVASPDQEAVSAVLQSAMETARRTLKRRNGEALDQRELAALLAVMLLEP